MRNLLAIERFCLYGHVVAMVFGLAGLLWVVPHPGILEYLPAGQTMFRWSMAGGGVGYILLGTMAMALYAYRTLGLGSLITFAIAAVGISVTSELLGTSTGFPFGNYTYLNGLGYKVAGLVPFTIPLSWFYLGLAAFLLARSGLAAGGGPERYNWLRSLAAVLLGSVLLTSWDFVLDPAMSQTALPFWYWHEPGAFFGMPYQNFAGWLGTGVVFMGVALGLWKVFRFSPELDQDQLVVPLVVYLANFGFALVMSLAAGFYVPIALGMLTGALPAVLCWRATTQEHGADSDAESIEAIGAAVDAGKVALK
ncbi:MAG: carotenoid biosynthesis protein [Leptolyngbya sp.]|jgi:putative membrane protein|uniref:Carotenoid biosynthesis protein n=1 Tax=Shackletoniella antarctica TaxID=268115 RepID=A0A2W4WPU7_9CYAN|nr:MAG: carotenoid biosynthesis protein [Shackletoniella antarctica]PZV19882.1 MAG: carotenoid biosynthesis protein [Leptolyngbya sp.]